MAAKLTYRTLVSSAVERAAEGVLSVTVSTGGTDRFNTVISPKGGDLRNYLANPIVLWAHQRDQLPIAQCQGLRRLDDELVARVDFTKTSRIYPFADLVRQYYEEGLLRGWSIGFIPRKTAMPEKQGEPIEFLEWELVEFSAAPIPANPDALTKVGQLYREAVPEQVLVRGLRAGKDLVQVYDEWANGREQDDDGMAWDNAAARRRVRAWAAS